MEVEPVGAEPSQAPARRARQAFCGWALLTRNSEAIGAVFDGNIHSLGGNYGYDPALNRTVSVSAAAISEALRKAYRADALADELAKGA